MKMKMANILLGKEVMIDETSSINNVKIGDFTTISKYCTIFGSEENIMQIGEACHISMYSILNGYYGLEIGNRVSFGPRVTIMTDTLANNSPILQEILPHVKKAVKIEDDCNIGAHSVIMPGVSLGKGCIVGANSFVKDSFGPYSIIAGSPARLIRKWK